MSNEIELLIGEVDTINSQIFELQKTISDKVNALSVKRMKAQELLDEKISQEALSQLSSKEYGCGTANIETDNYKIKAVVSKTVKWDEDILRKIAKKISDAGLDPEAFIKYKLSVSETAFKGYPDAVKQEFVPARSVEPSKPKITYERKV